MYSIVCWTLKLPLCSLIESTCICPYFWGGALSTTQQWPFNVKVLHPKWKRRGFCLAAKAGREEPELSAGCCLFCRWAEGTTFANMIFSAKRKLQEVCWIIQGLSFRLTMRSWRVEAAEWNSWTAISSWETTEYEYPWANEQNKTLQMIKWHAQILWHCLSCIVAVGCSSLGRVPSSCSSPVSSSRGTSGQVVQAPLIPFPVQKIWVQTRVRGYIWRGHPVLPSTR